MGKCYFNKAWLDNANYKPWLTCLACGKSFDTSNMGEHAVKSHAKGKIHLQNVERRTTTASSSRSMVDFSGKKTLIITPAAFKGLRYPADVIKLDLRDKDIMLPVQKIDMGMAADRELRQAKLSDLQQFGLREQFRSFIKFMVQKLLDKAPLTYKAVRQLSCRNPVLMATDKSRAALKLKNLLMILAEACWVPWSDVDSLLSNWRDVLDQVSEREELKSRFLEFRPSSSRLDEFLYEYLQPLSAPVWKQVRMLLLLSHGQASVGRGFSFNKELVCEKLSENSLVAQRHILDYIKQQGGTQHVPITRQLLDAARMGRQRYHFLEEEEKKKRREEKVARKRCREDEEVQELVVKRHCLEREEKALLDEAEKCVDVSETTNEVSAMKKWKELMLRAKAIKANLLAVKEELAKRQNNRC